MPTHQDSPKINSISSRELFNLLESPSERFILIDVRGRSELESTGAIPGALHVALPFLEERHLPENKEHKVIFSCASGNRSSLACEKATAWGYTNIYNHAGGIKSWGNEKLPTNAITKGKHQPSVKVFFEPVTATAQYLVTDDETRETYIVDPVLDFDMPSGKISHASADQLLGYVEKHNLNVTKILETHVHADHLTAAQYLKAKLKATSPVVCIGSHVKEVQEYFRGVYNLPKNILSPTGEQFDHLFQDGETWMLGQDIQCMAISTPGHTPACMSYLFGDIIMCGDTLFHPTSGTARCDFPGGDAEIMYESIQKIFALPDNTRVFLCHDYPIAGQRGPEFMNTVAEHKAQNVMINSKTSKDQYVNLRKARDAKLSVPKLLHPSLQTNLRAGNIPPPEPSVDNDKDGGSSFFKIPIRNLQ